MLNAVNALPQLEQADKLLTRLPRAKWAADMHTAASEPCKRSAPAIKAVVYCLLKLLLLLLLHQLSEFEQILGSHAYHNVKNKSS